MDGLSGSGSIQATGNSNDSPLLPADETFLSSLLLVQGVRDEQGDSHRAVALRRAINRVLEGAIDELGAYLTRSMLNEIAPIATARARTM